MVIASNELENCRIFLKSLLNIFKKAGNIITVLFDFNEIFEDLKPFTNSYCNKDYSDFLDSIIKFAETKIANTQYNLTIFITGVEKYKDMIDESKIDELNDTLKKIPNSNIIYVDDVFKLKKMIFEPWYSDYVVNSNGIWIGSGVGEQSVLRASTITKKHNLVLKNNFAWIFKNGDTELIKIVECEGENEEQNTN